jgi:hypothetical protein
LFGFGDVGDDVEPADRFFFRNVKGGSGFLEVFAVGGIFGPQVVTGEIFQLLGVFD